MVTATRINILKDLNFIIPAITGLVLLVYISILTATFISRHNEDEARLLLAKRDAMVAEYESYQSNFNMWLSDILTISVQAVPADYSYTLARFENENIIMASLAEDILKSSIKAKSNTVDIDRARVANHEVYSKLIVSLTDYSKYITSERNVRKCFNDINVQGSDKSVVTGINKCEPYISSLINTYNDLPKEVSTYWTTYVKYWNIVESIHSNPNKDKVSNLQSDLKNTYNNLETLYSNYVKALELQYKNDLLKTIQVIK